MNKKEAYTAAHMHELSEPMYQQINGEKNRIQKEKDEANFKELINLIRDTAEAGGRSLDLFKTEKFGWDGERGLNETIQNWCLQLGYRFSDHNIPNVETCPNGVINW